MYRAVSYLEVDAALEEKDYVFWQDVLFRAVDEPSDVLEGRTDPISLPDQVEVYLVCEENKTQFRYDLEMNLCGGQSEEEFGDEVRRAVHLLTQDVPPSVNFRLSLDLYYLEHDADYSVEYDRAELAA
jgi:hypothetical protein